MEILQQSFDPETINDQATLIDEALHNIRPYYEHFTNLGFTLKAYNCLSNDEYGTHCLVLEEPEGFKYPTTTGFDYLMQDSEDEDQPFSTYRYHNGTLFLYIPFFC